jgi:hypothetical protein
MSEHPNLAAALAAAQAEYPRIEKTSVNPHFKSRYTDLGDGMEHIRPILSRHGLAYAQSFDVVDGTLVLVTELLRGAEAKKSILPIIQPPKAQDFVSLSTYYRRVALFSLAGITPVNEDDDGNTANDVAPAQVEPRQTRQPDRQPEHVKRGPMMRAQEEAMAAAGAVRAVDQRLIADARMYASAIAGMGLEEVVACQNWLKGEHEGTPHKRWQRLGQLDMDLRDELAQALSARADILGIVKTPQSGKVAA